MKQRQTQYKKENPHLPEHNGNAKSEHSHEVEGEGNYRITHKLVTENHGRAEVRERAEVKSRVRPVAVESSPIPHVSSKLRSGSSVSRVPFNALFLSMEE